MCTATIYRPPSDVCNMCNHRSRFAPTRLIAARNAEILWLGGSEMGCFCCWFVAVRWIYVLSVMVVCGTVYHQHHHFMRAYLTRIAFQSSSIGRRAQVRICMHIILHFLLPARARASAPCSGAVCEYVLGTVYSPYAVARKMTLVSRVRFARTFPCAMRFRWERFSGMCLSGFVRDWCIFHVRRFEYVNFWHGK